jgi:orotidine-5'-phosphate decarboxylase
MEGIEKAKERLIVALDVSSEEEALELVKELKDWVGYFKVGLELLTSAGIEVIPKIKELGGKIFYDGKFKDIPNTVAGASRGVTRLGVNMFDVHAMGGLEMMKEAVKAAKDEATTLGIEAPWVLGVTILTSIDQEILNKELRIPGTAENQVGHLARLVEEAGLDGVIASPQEIEIIRQETSGQLFIITPGIRPHWAAPQDQKRILTPGEAITRGAFALVIGRPITRPPKEIGNRVEAARRIAEEIAHALPY